MTQKGGKEEKSQELSRENSPSQPEQTPSEEVTT